jgi:alkylation response protein AidB-like acyl-CoA dehydrogenase
MMERNIYNEEHTLFAQSVREFVAKEIVPYNAQWEKDHMVSRESWLKFGESGFLCMQVAEEYGGLGINDFRYNAIVTEELARTGCAGPAVGYPLHSDIVCPYIEHYGTEAVKQKWLPKMVSGEAIAAIAMTEPGAGSDLQGMRATAVDKGDYYLVNGSKTFITNGYLCDVVVVAVKTDPTKGAKGISLLVIDTSMKGFTKGKPFEKVGLHAQDTCELFFENVEVPKENLLGKEGEGFKYLMTELSQERTRGGTLCNWCSRGSTGYHRAIHQRPHSLWQTDCRAAEHPLQTGRGGHRNTDWTCIYRPLCGTALRKETGSGICVYG